MADREKMGTTLNAAKQIQDGTVDEPLLSKDLLQKFSAMEKRISDLEKQLDDFSKADFLGAYNKAKSSKS